MEIHSFPTLLWGTAESFIAAYDDRHKHGRLHFPSKENGKSLEDIIKDMEEYFQVNSVPVLNSATGTQFSPFPRYTDTQLLMSTRLKRLVALLCLVCDVLSRATAGKHEIPVLACTECSPLNFEDTPSFCVQRKVRTRLKEKLQMGVVNTPT